MSKEEKEILELLIKETQGMRTKELSEALGVSAKTVITRTQELVKKGLVSVIGKSQRDPKRKYILTTEGETLSSK